MKKKKAKKMYSACPPRRAVRLLVSNFSAVSTLYNTGNLFPKLAVASRRGNYKVPTLFLPPSSGLSFAVAHRTSSTGASGKEGGL